MRRGKHHCRQCGEIFCRDCSNYNSKLNTQGEPDDYGMAFRVCKKCFEGDGRIYIAPDLHRPDELRFRMGAQQDLMSDFKQALADSERKRLEQKSALRDLANLRKKMADVRPADVRESSKAAQYRVAPFWSEDTGSCARCRESFGLMGKKHHCRLCGELFCEKCSAKTDVDVECMDDDRQSGASDLRELSFIAVQPHGQVWVCADPKNGERIPPGWTGGCETKLRLEPREGGIRLHGRAKGGERFATKEELLAEKALADKVYTPLKRMEQEAERCLNRFATLRHELVAQETGAPGLQMTLSRNTKSNKLEIAKLHHDLRILLSKYKTSRKSVTLLPHRTEKTKRIAAAVLKSTNEWYAYAYFSYNEHKKEIYKFYREEVLEQEWKHHPPKKLGSVYGFVMRMLFEWDRTPLIQPYLRGDSSGEFELPSGCEKTALYLNICPCLSSVCKRECALVSPLVYCHACICVAGRDSDSRDCRQTMLL